ncbi:hypothetical protein SKAU_G00360130 [Synaphobranchus kaupii]|uniref:Uncharacterized protein n=1 Tax=Synaphobranchus kaupii TaxID=118154 RepID=A0A9Q1IGT2_SYNKA|nr:hypothetical protein SKAU_G00360130 [Synaphobranchus kaupii]
MGSKWIVSGADVAPPRHSRGAAPGLPIRCLSEATPLLIRQDHPTAAASLSVASAILSSSIRARCFCSAMQAGSAFEECSTPPAGFWRFSRKVRRERQAVISFPATAA